MSQYQSESPHVRAIEQTDVLAFDYALNKRDHLRAEIVQRNHPVVVLSRWKAVGSGYKRTGKSLEFAAHHVGGILDLLRHLQRALNSQKPNFDQLENAANDVAHCNILRPSDGYGSNGDCDCETACPGEGKTSALGPPFEVIREKAGDQPSGSLVRLGRYSFACGVEKFARSDRTFAVDGAAWESDPLLLGTPNGTADRRTSVLRPPTPEDRITKTSAIVPAEHSECPMSRWQVEQEKIRKLHDSPGWQAELERVRLIAEKLRKAETTTPRPQSETPKRRRGGGRHRSLTPEQIEEGIGILRNQPRMTVEAARATLRDAGINGSPSALYRLVIVPAYASGS
jgi:hypothetical protein